LEEEPRPRGEKKLQAEDAYRLRVGNYHVVIFVVDGIYLPNWVFELESIWVN
jgi:mRNA-degrading endonuclease RelE of RelBE toxin-antitoxin system